MNTYRVPHRAADAGSVTVDKSVTPHGVHDKEAAEVSQKGKETQNTSQRPGGRRQESQLSGREREGLAEGGRCVNIQEGWKSRSRWWKLLKPEGRV